MARRPRWGPVLSVWLFAACMAWGDAPMFEAYQLPTGLAGNVEIPTLGTWDGQTVHCVYSNNIESVWVQSTRDAGKTWSGPIRVMALGEARYITDANILVDRDRITVFATEVIDAPDHPGAFARSRIRMAVSEDGGQIWAEQPPLPLPHNYVCGCIHPPVWLDGDTVVMGWSWDVPAEEGRPAAEEGTMHLRAGVLISDDRGRTWRPGQDVDLPEQPMGADEPAIVRLSTGGLFMIVRTTYPRPYETVSHDGGQTWEPLRPAACHGFNSPSALLRLRDGGIIRAWDDSPTARFPLVVSVSTDDCQTWSPPRTVTEPTPELDGTLSYSTACYPSLAEAEDGSILLAWWQRRDETNSVHVARFSRDWIEQARAQRTIVAFGDSVTRGVRDGVTEYQTFRHLLHERLEQGGIEARVVNAGVGGDTTDDGLSRLDRDVLREKPELVIVMFGLNDAAMVDAGPVARTEPRVPPEAYTANLRSIVERIRASGSAVLVCTPTPMSRRYVHQNVGAYAGNEDINFAVRLYAEAVRRVAGDMQVPLFDAFALFADRPGGLELIEDGDHPFARGHALLADALLEPVLQLLGAP